MSKQIIAWDLSNLYKGIDDPKIVEDMKNIEKLEIGRASSRERV